MRTARAWGVPLSVLNGGAPAGVWSSRDRLLAVALTQLEASLCGGCGYPQWLGFDADVSWEVPDAPLKCHACASRDAAVHAWDRASGETGPQDRPALRWPVHQHISEQ